MRLTRNFVGLLAIGALIVLPAQAMAQAKRPNPQEKKESLLTNLLVPKNTFDYLLKSEPASAASPS